MTSIPLLSVETTPSARYNPSASPVNSMDQAFKNCTAHKDGCREWKHWSLKWWFLSIAISFHISFIISILVLLYISRRNNGFVEVPQTLQPTPSLTDIGNTLVAFAYSGLLWTSLPTFVMSLLKLAFGASLSATETRQPFVELNRKELKASSVRKTLALDYRGSNRFKTLILASGNGHQVIALAVLGLAALDTLVVPLTAHLFSASIVYQPTDTTVLLSSVFDGDDSSQNIPATELFTPIGVASAVVALGASPPPWMTTKYGFPAISGDNLGLLANVSVTLPAQYADLNCQILDRSQYTLPTLDNNSTPITITLQDRNCSFSTQVLYNPSTRVLASALNTQACSFDAGYSRLAYIGGTFNGTSSGGEIRDFIAVSCIPTYWSVNGTTSIQYQRSRGPLVTGFLNTTVPTQFRPGFRTTLESNLVISNDFDPSNTFSSNNFGRQVFAFVSQRNASRPFDAALSKEGMQSLFSATYAALTSTKLFSPTSSVAIDAILVSPQSRLFVNEIVAWIVVGLLIFSTICNILLLWRASTNHTMLAQDPKGLLGLAAVLRGSDVLEYVTKGMTAQRNKKLLPCLDVKEFDVDRDLSWYDADYGYIRVKA